MQLSKNGFCEKHDKVKKCEFIGCDTTFFGRGKTRYCTEHRKKKYYFSLYHKEKPTPIDVNQVIQHKNIYSPNMTLKCSLEGCNNNFDIVLTPRVYVFPKYCQEHRNEWKRQLFLKNNQIVA
jgi:hypothetical protein